MGIQAVTSATANSTQASGFKTQDSQEINIPIGQTQDKKTEDSSANRNARYKLASIKENLPKLKQQYPKKANEIQRTFDNTRYKVDENGLVTFEFTGPVNVETFKLIFMNSGQNGLFRNYLTERHNSEEVKMDYVESTDGKVYHADDVESFVINGCVQDDPEAKLVHYWLSDTGSTIVYEDGYAQQIVPETCFFGWFNTGGMITQTDYTRMSFNVNDSNKIQVHYSRIKDPQK